LCCLSLLGLRLLITLLVSSNLDVVLSVPLSFTASDYPFGIFKHLVIVLSVPLWFTASDYPFSIFKLGRCVVCPS